MNDDSVTDKLSRAYEQMLERIEGVRQQAEQNTLPQLRELIATARDRAVELGELTREEAEQISEYLRRDLHEAAQSLADSDGNLSRWARFDLAQIESRTLELLLSAADRTRLELGLLADHARQTADYHTGEISSAGSLVCQQCGQWLHMHGTGRIPPCPACHGTHFKRGADDE